MSQGDHKLWGGRFAGGPAPELEAANRSIGTDIRLWRFDIQLSQAWARGLVAAGVVAEAEADAIVTGLDHVAKRIEGGEQPISSDEDVHTFVDRLLHEEAGEPASRLHTGRSRNDQVATGTRLWTLDATTRIEDHLRELQRVIVTRAEQQQDAVMPSYTHLQRAQPVSVAHWLLAHFWALERDHARLLGARDAASSLPLGSGAIAGSAFPVPREELRVQLGFARLSPNSIDAVGDRDFITDLLYALTMLGTHLSRLAEDLILFGSSEFGFVRFGDAFSTGSSMMPQKRNPDALELARGSAGRMLGDLVALIVALKGLPSGYNKDLQDDKRVLFDAVDAMLLLLPAISGSIATLSFDQRRMSAAVTSTMMATDLADFLVRRRVTFREAHVAVGQLVREAEERGVELSALPFSSYSRAHASFTQEAMLELTPEQSLRHRELPGGTGKTSVAAQLANAKALIG